MRSVYVAELLRLADYPDLKNTFFQEILFWVCFRPRVFFLSICVGDMSLGGKIRFKGRLNED